MMSKEITSFVLVICLSGSFLGASVHCSGDMDSRQLSPQEQELMAVVDRILPQDLVSRIKVILDNHAGSPVFEDFIVLLLDAAKKLEAALKQEDKSSGLIRSAASTEPTVEELIAQVSENLENTYGSVNCGLLAAGLGYGRGVEVKLLEISGALGIGLALGLKAHGGGGVEMVYDLLHLQRAVFPFTACGAAIFSELGLLVEAGPGGTVGFSGFADWMVGFGNADSVLSYQGAASGSQVELYGTADILGNLVVGIQVGYWRGRDLECDFPSAAICPENATFAVENAFQGVTMGYGGSGGVGIAAGLAIGLTDGVVNTCVLGGQAFEDWSKDINDESARRLLASFNIAKEIMLIDPLPGVSALPWPSDSLAVAATLLYGLVDIEISKAQCGAMAGQCGNDKCNSESGENSATCPVDCAPCLPDCTGNECGDSDGCGGKCWQCSSPKQVCVPGPEWLCTDRFEYCSEVMECAQQHLSADGSLTIESASGLVGCYTRAPANSQSYSELADCLWTECGDPKELLIECVSSISTCIGEFTSLFPCVESALTGACSDEATVCSNDTPPASCGNDDCEDGETACNCPKDCQPECGDGCCSQEVEDADSCPSDCECEPDCVGKVCGDDGCGTQCGKCDDGQTCVSGKCVESEFCGDEVCDEQDENCESCPDDCSCSGGEVCYSQECCEPTSCGVLGKECGTWDDKCGSAVFCGDCNQFPNSFCTYMGVCDCTANCSGKQCGDDGCGTPCGECGPNYVCAADNKCYCQNGSALCNEICCAQEQDCYQGACCTKQCDGKNCGDDGCGDICGSCSVGEFCSNGTCEVLGCWPECGEMVGVPAGSFMMGCNHLVDSDCTDFDYEKPYHPVEVPSFDIDKTEVTVSAYTKCVDAGECSSPGTWGGCNWSKGGKEQYPVNCVNWTQAKAYCQWVGKRLCSESEWEKAARSEDGRKYPWGNSDPDCDKAVYSECNCGAESCWVGSRPGITGPFGTVDMAGNVAEWVEDVKHDTYIGAPADGTPWGGDHDQRVIRGGGYDDDPFEIRTSYRDFTPHSDADSSTGFRCCRSM